MWDGLKLQQKCENYSDTLPSTRSSKGLSVQCLSVCDNDDRFRHVEKARLQEFYLVQI